MNNESPVLKNLTKPRRFYPLRTENGENMILNVMAIKKIIPVNEETSLDPTEFKDDDTFLIYLLGEENADNPLQVNGKELADLVFFLTRSSHM